MSCQLFSRWVSESRSSKNSRSRSLGKSPGLVHDAEEVPVLERFSFLPGPIFITEVDPFAERRMRTTEEGIEKSWTGHREVVRLQFHETHRSPIIIFRDLQAKAIGLMLNVPAERQAGGDHYQRINVHQQDNE